MEAVGNILRRHDRLTKVVAAGGVLVGSGLIGHAGFSAAEALQANPELSFIQEATGRADTYAGAILLVLSGCLAVAKDWFEPDETPEPEPADWQLKGPPVSIPGEGVMYPLASQHVIRDDGAQIGDTTVYTITSVPPGAETAQT